MMGDDLRQPISHVVSVWNCCRQLVRDGGLCSAIPRRQLKQRWKYFILGALASGLLLYRHVHAVTDATGTLEVNAHLRRMAARRIPIKRCCVRTWCLIAFSGLHLLRPPYVGSRRLPRRAHRMTMLIGTAPKLAGFRFPSCVFWSRGMQAADDPLVGHAGDTGRAGRWQCNISAIAQTNINACLVFDIGPYGFCWSVC